MSNSLFIPTAHSAQLEAVKTTFGSSIFYKKFSDLNPNSGGHWHYHPEIELVYIERGSGKRHIGNHLSLYTRGDLLLIGPNVPHYGFTNRMINRNKEIVIQFKEDFIGNAIAHTTEFSKIKDLFQRSSHGLSFCKGPTRRKVAKVLEEMSVQSPFARLLSLLHVLEIMASTEDYDILNTDSVTIKTKHQSTDRLQLIYKFVRTHFQDEMDIAEVAALTHMTIPSLSRWFKQETGRTFSHFVNTFRITHACKLLTDTPRTITEIAFDCGYSNFSYFNRQFKKITGKSPSAYRAEVIVVISDAPMDE